MLGKPLYGERYARLNRDLFNEFGAMLAAAKWDMALLQECPPRWSDRLPDACRATGRRALTSRNWLSPVTTLSARQRPQLIGSWEGGSNLTMVRKGKPGAALRGFETKTLTLLPERRVASLTWLENGLCLANLHASQKGGELDVLTAAEFAVSRAGEGPLVLGGDFNVRPGRSELFDQLSDRFGFSGPTDPGAIDHLLVRNAEIVEQTVAWPPSRRDVPDRNSDFLIRLSDHAPVISSIRF